MANKNNQTKKSNEELVSVFIPKQGRNDTERFVAVNGERILVQTGKTVEVPKRFAEVIKNSEAMAAVSAAYIDANISIQSPVASCQLPELMQQLYFSEFICILNFEF